MIRYFLWRFCSILWRRLPLRVGYACATLVADITYWAWPRGRAYARRSIGYILDNGHSPADIDSLARRSLRNYCKYLVDFIRFPVIDESEIQRRIVFDGWENFDRALASGKGAVFVGLHLGNWDLAAAAISLRRYPINVIAESFSPAALNQVVQQARAQKGMQVIPLERAPRRLLAALRRNEIVALLIDRPSPGDGVVVRFCNARMQVPSGAAMLSLRTGAPVVTGGLVRLPDNRFLGFVDPSLSFTPSGDIKMDVQALTQEIMNSLERWVRRYPDQWYVFRPMWLGTD
ncbi:MAG: lysophospholipid acyltransferase family protein [Chloroflexi bacterium]|nr:lysophospholipid acyltransferase family protein [Chloroflexota bacterium]